VLSVHNFKSPFVTDSDNGNGKGAASDALMRADTPVQLKLKTKPRTKRKFTE
jgi:hypothetical protein